MGLVPLAVSRKVEAQPGQTNSIPLTFHSFSIPGDITRTHVLQRQNTFECLKIRDDAVQKHMKTEDYIY